MVGAWKHYFPCSWLNRQGKSGTSKKQLSWLGFFFQLNSDLNYLTQHIYSKLVKEGGIKKKDHFEASIQ